MSARHSIKPPAAGGGQCSPVTLRFSRLSPSSPVTLRSSRLSLSPPPASHRPLLPPVTLPSSRLSPSPPPFPRCNLLLSACCHRLSQKTEPTASNFISPLSLRLPRQKIRLAGKTFVLAAWEVLTDVDQLTQQLLWTKPPTPGYCYRHSHHSLNSLF